MADVIGQLGTPRLMALAIVALACVTDVRTRRIPNSLSLGGALLALAYSVMAGGLPGLMACLGGFAVGLAVFLPFFLLGGMGAGDVKLMACLGAWLGPTLVLWTAAYSAIAGGVLAIAVALATGYLRAAVDNLYLLLAHFRVAGVRSHPDLTLERGKGPRLPYALPIAAGAVVAMWLH